MVHNVTSNILVFLFFLFSIFFPMLKYTCFLLVYLEVCGLILDTQGDWRACQLPHRWCYISLIVSISRILKGKILMAVIKIAKGAISQGEVNAAKVSVNKACIIVQSAAREE